MVASLFDITTLISPLAEGELILTANNRLRNHILRAYAAYQSNRGCKSWPAPRIYPLNQWLRACWQDLQDQAYPQALAMIASNFQRQYWWEEIITQSEISNALLQPEPLAQSADAALRTLELWDLAEIDLTGHDNLNTATFCVWLAEFRQRLQSARFITEETAQARIAQAFADRVLPVLPRIYLQGFDDIPPLYRRLIQTAALEVVDLATPRHQHPGIRRVNTINDEAELRAAALWSKTQLEQNADAVIGIIVPNLGQSRDQVERIFTEVFEPLAALPQIPRYTLPFNFSAGTPLAATPLVFAALELLDLNRGHWELEPLCDLLQSPFFGDADNELVVRTNLCAQLRKLGKFTISASDLRHYSQRLCEKLIHDGNHNGHHNDGHDDSLAARFLRLETHRRASAGKHSAAFWVDFFQQQLQLLGWPGSRRLDSQEYQQIQLWYKVLEEFVTLDSSQIRLDFHRALKQLRNLMGKTPFQAQTPDSPIQILGALEGAGLQFSHAWILGLHHRQWPPAPAPNPFLPLNLQREHKMPHASAERELIYARALTDNYRYCATDVVFSSASNDSEHRLQPSALIRDIPLTDLAECVPQTRTCAQENLRILSAAQALELVDCARGPKMSATDLVTRGGSSLFKHQAACPFNAFARLRLGAQLPDQPMVGLSPIERGNILHDALAMVWRKLENSNQLQAMNDSEVHALLAQTTAAALSPVQQRRPRELGNFYCHLEQERLLRLLTAWLAEEKNRPAFRVIAIEQEGEVQFAGLRLKLRIDRIDQLENGDVMLIDYKTGEPKAKSWFGERPDEPQLPLYAVSHHQQVAAIAFAQLNAKKSQWIGTGNLTNHHPGFYPPPIDWQQQLEEWQRVLAHLAQDFIAGDARVDFKDRKAQAYAEDLLPLNRLLEADGIEQWMISHKKFISGDTTRDA